IVRGHVPGLGTRLRLEVERRRQVRRRGRVDPTYDGGRQDERLERRPRLTPRLRRQVELVLRPARYHPGHRADGARARVDRDDRGGGVGRVVERFPDRVLRQPLEAPVDRGVDAETAGFDAALAVAVNELLAHEAEEVRLADAGVQRSGAEVQLPVRNRIAKLAQADVATVLPGAKPDVPPEDLQARGYERVVGGRRLRQPGQHGRLLQVQAPSPPREVRLRRGLDAVRMVAVVDVVQVGGQDALLRPGLVQLDRQAGLLDLARERALSRRDVEQAHQLLRDRRAALDDPARTDVRPQRAGDALVVNAPML